MTDFKSSTKKHSKWSRGSSSISKKTTTHTSANKYTRQACIDHVLPKILGEQKTRGVIFGNASGVTIKNGKMLVHAAAEHRLV